MSVFHTANYLSGIFTGYAAPTFYNREGILTVSMGLALHGVLGDSGRAVAAVVTMVASSMFQRAYLPLLGGYAAFAGPDCWIGLANGFTLAVIDQLPRNRIFRYLW